MRIRLHVDTKGSWAFHGTPFGRTGIQASEVIAMDTGSVPPPPIPPPPPPPPPPLPAPAASFSKLGSARRLRLRNLNWECIPKERVEGRRSVWSDSLSSDDDDFPIDLRSLDELFGRKEGRKPDRADSLYRSLRQSGSLQDPAADKVSLLDSKRSMNVGIFLRQFKIEVREIVADVRRGGGERYGAEKLTELCKLLPDSEEEARLKRFNGEHSLLREPDLFMLLLVEVPNFRLRVDAMILRQEFDPAVTSLCVAARCLGEAARELLSCHKLHSILRLVLKAGNYMNAGGYAGNAAGFRITSLLRLADTKANKPGMNLLHFVAMEAVKKDEDLLTFPSLLSHVSSASRLSEESVLEDLSRLRSRVAALRVSTRAEAEIEPQTRPFLEVADVRLKEAQEEVDGLRKTSQALMEFFCEDETSFKLEEACRIFHCFCHRFQRAVRENLEREQQEQRRVEREREREKLRSLVVCSGLDEPDDLERTLKRSLSCTWSRRSLRRHTQRVPNFEEKRSDSNVLQPIQSAGQEISQALDSEGCNRSSVLSKHVLIKDCNDDYGLDSPEETNITKKVGPRKASPLTLESPVLKVEAQVHITSEKLTHIMPDNLTEAEKLGCMDAPEASPPQLLSEPGVALQVDTMTPSLPVAELWLGSCLPKGMPQLAQELKPACPDRSCIYPRLGESVECHTLVKGLRSYEAFSPGGTRPAPSHCSKWRKELDAGERDRSSSPQPKEDLQAGKALTRNPTKRGLAIRSGLLSSTSIPKVRAKVELGLVDGPPTARTSRFSPARSSSTRSSTSTRPTGMQSELKRTSSIRDKAGSLVHQLGRQERQPVEKAARAKDAVLPGREPFIRGSPLRVSKRLAPISEAQSLCQPRAGHSPTAKTIRTAVINAAKNKTSKNAETASPPKPMTGTRSAGPKIPRPTTQPMWR